MNATSTHSPEEESLCCELFCVRLAPVLLLFFHFLEINICHYVQYSCLLHLSNLSAKETRSHVFRDKNIPWNRVIHTCNILKMSVCLYCCICNTFHTLYWKTFNWVFISVWKKIFKSLNYKYREVSSYEKIIKTFC